MDHNWAKRDKVSSQEEKHCEIYTRGTQENRTELERTKHHHATYGEKHNCGDDTHDAAPPNTGDQRQKPNVRAQQKRNTITPKGDRLSTDDTQKLHATAREQRAKENQTTNNYDKRREHNRHVRNN